jgi:hypothetical protein
MTDNIEAYPIIGKDIDWKTAAYLPDNALLRVLRFTPFATVEGKKVKALSSRMPYAVLTVESLALKRLFTVHVTHKLDFRYLHSAFKFCSDPQRVEALFMAMDDDPVFRGSEEKLGFKNVYTELWGTQEVEILIGDLEQAHKYSEGSIDWIGRKLNMMPRLFVWICPKGYLERFVSDSWWDVLDDMGPDLWFEAVHPLVELKPEE